MRHRLFVLVLAVLVLPVAGSARGEQPPFLSSARVAIVGDSITEQKLYSKYVECWLLACSGIPDVQVMQFGWSGERADGFARRADNDLAVFKPTVVTLCYGMNDGGYQPWKPEIGVAYEKNMRQVLEQLDAAGVKTVVVGSPGAVDTHFFRPGQKMGEVDSHVAYNDTLAHLRDIDRRLATEQKRRFADVHAAMTDAMAKAQAKLGATYDVCGRDGFHPNANGQLLMAYAFLEGLGVDGTIATFDVDMAAGLARAVAGSGQTLSVKAPAGGARKPGDSLTVDVESSRWPFCFEGDGTASGGTRSILPFVPFNEKFNRYVLRVSGIETPRARVRWGQESREFTREQLAAGVNLAAEFTATPFDPAFAALRTTVAEKQQYETYMIKQIVTDFRWMPGIEETEVRAAVKVLVDRLRRKWNEMESRVRERLVPVKHSIAIEPLAG